MTSIVIALSIYQKELISMMSNLLFLLYLGGLCLLGIAAWLGLVFAICWLANGLTRLVQGKL